MSLRKISPTLFFFIVVGSRLKQPQQQQGHWNLLHRLLRRTVEDSTLSCHAFIIRPQQQQHRLPLLSKQQQVRQQLFNFCSDNFYGNHHLPMCSGSENGNSRYYYYYPLLLPPMRTRRMSALAASPPSPPNLVESNPNNDDYDQEEERPLLSTTPVTPKRTRSSTSLKNCDTTMTTDPTLTTPGTIISPSPVSSSSTNTTTPTSSTSRAKKRRKLSTEMTTNDDDDTKRIVGVPITPESTTVVRRQRQSKTSKDQDIIPTANTSSTTTSATYLTTTTTSPSTTTTKRKTTRSPSKIETESTPTKSTATTPEEVKASPKTLRPKKASKGRSFAPPKEESWKPIYDLVFELRKDRSAPVDTNGSEALPQRELGPKTFRFQVLIALMLSSQTKDVVVGDAMRTLQAHGLTVEKLLSEDTTYEKLNEMIWKVGFHNTKAKNILSVAELLHTNYEDDIPPTAQEMIDVLPGVGPKMAFIVENVAWGKTTGIGVDTHMHRMFNQLHWVNSTQPEQTRLQLESWLPKEYWSTVNLVWVGFGQEVQQFQDKLLRKCLDCSKPKEALKLVQKLGLDYRKVGMKMGCMTEIETILSSQMTKTDNQQN